MSDKPLRIDADKAGAARCRKPGGLAFFVKEFWSTIVPNKLKWVPHMDILCEEIQRADERVFLRMPRDKDLIINVPPGTSKTKIVSILSTAWEFARMPEIKVFVGSYSDSAVSGIADEIRLVMRSEKYRMWFPDVMIRKDMGSLHNFKTESNGEFYAFTVGGTLTSKHADILKIDDPLNPKMAASEADLKSTNFFFDQTLPSRKVDKAVTLTSLVMQRLDENDPTGHLLKKKAHKIRHIKLPGVAVDVKPAEYADIYQYINLPDDHPLAKKYGKTYLGFLDLERNGPDVLADLLLDLGSWGYAAQGDQEPSSSKGKIWQKEWFIIVPDEDWPNIELGTNPGSDWDLAYTKNDKNAASAYITSFRYNNRIFIDDFDWAWKEFPELIRWMKSKKGPHYIEAKASGKSSKQTLTKMNIVAIEVPVKGGEDKVVRARMSSPIAESGVVCVRKSMADRFFNDGQQGICNFPDGTFKDLADTLAQCLQRHTTTGFKYHSENQYEEEEEDLLGQLGY
jgi:phage terminase large subunit-like protein